MVGGLRDAWDADKDGKVDPLALETASDPRKPHLRGAVLVAAVYQAFATIYHRRVADLLSLAGRMEGRIDPVILQRLTREAVLVGGQVLNMALRALDYLPPVDVRFGEYLRAIVSADVDLVPHDPQHFRLAFIEAFRQRGILPSDCLSLAPENLVYAGPEDERINARDLVDLKRSRKFADQALDLEPRFDREATTKQAEANRYLVHQWLIRPDEEPGRAAAWEAALGVFFSSEREGRAAAPRTIHRAGDGLAVEVHSVRTARRTGPDGQDLRQLIVQVTQRRRGFFDMAVQAAQDAGAGAVIGTPDFWFRGGATVIIDLREGEYGTIRRLIRKPIDDDDRLAAQRRSLVGGAMLGLSYGSGGAEPFAIAHRH